MPATDSSSPAAPSSPSAATRSPSLTPTPPTSVPRSFPWAGAVTTLYERILEESKKKERKHSCGLLKEIHQIERCSRQLMEITDASQFPLAEEKDAEVREATRELVQVCETLKDGLDPLERQVREMFHRIVRTRTDILDSLSRPHNTE